MSIFSDAEKTYLRRMKDDVLWNSILRKLSESTQFPRFRPKGGDQQEKSWIYSSGVFDEQDRIIHLLKGE